MRSAPDCVYAVPGYALLMSHKRHRTDIRASLMTFKISAFDMHQGVVNEAKKFAGAPEVFDCNGAFFLGRNVGAGPATHAHLALHGSGHGQQPRRFALCGGHPTVA